MRIIGVTGPTGSGKSYLCSALSDRGIPCIDADEVYHSLLIPPSACLDALREAFGDGVFAPDGSLDRTALGSIVFASPEKLELLNRTVLGHVLDRTRDMLAELEQKGHGVAVVDAPTLIESGFHRECDTVISVIAPPEVRLKRIITRDAITKEAALRRISAQKSDSFYAEASDTVLINDGDRKAFEDKVDRLLESIVQALPKG